MKYINIFFLLVIFSCSPARKKADMIFFNGTVITMDDSVADAGVVVVKDGRILAMGGQELLSEYTCEKENLCDLRGQFLYPGLIDAHCHFYGYARNMLSCDLVGTTSWQEVISRLKTFAAASPSKWLTGRGWDQNDWQDKNYPDNTLLNLLFPNRPVVLKRIDGHAVICNHRALELAGINEVIKVKGGEIITDDNGRMTGVLVDNAVDLVEKVIDKPSRDEMTAVLKKAEQECFSYGLTTLADAGLPLEDCLFLDSLGRNGTLSVYLYMMLNPDERAYAYALKNGVTENDFSRIGSFKLYADGALGSRGAKLKQDYCDRKGHAGLLIAGPSYFDSFCAKVYANTRYQVNTHCIGDSANRLILETYGRYLKGKNDRRWRIEHAQVTDTADRYLFGEYGILPSVQPTHATSDAPWAEERLCRHRMNGAYAYRSLLTQNGYLPLGTDFPVESVNPFHTFYSAVFRLNATQPGQAAFRPEEALTPEQALKGMTIWAAKACMLDHRKGSLRPGKDADLVIMDRNLLKAGPSEVLKTKVIATYARGRKVYGGG